jgi:cytochrome c556
MRRGPRLAVLTAVTLAATVAGGACYQDPEELIAQQQMLTDMSDAINEIGLQIADLNAAVDSLKAVVAKQDTAIYRIANVTGVPYLR